MIHGLFSVGIGQKSRGTRKRLSTAFSFSQLETLAMDEPLPYVPPPAPIFSFRDFPLHLLSFPKMYHNCNSNWVLCQS